MNGVQTRFKCKLDVKRCKRFVFPPSSLLPRSNALKTKAIRYFQTDRTLTRIVSPPLQEEEAMLYIWELGSCFVKDIVAKYPKPAPPYTTVASIVKNLERKQYIRAVRVGNTYQYTPLIRESEYKRTFMSGFVRNYFENSYKEMVSFFAKDQKISANDLKDIIDMIEKGKE